MYRIIAILLSNLILLQSLNIGLEDFSKIKVLIEHAQYHQEKYGDTFLEFLSEHYGDDENIEKNHKEHQDLPFKLGSQTCNHLPEIFTLNTQLFKANNTLVLEKEQNFYHKDLYSFFEKTSIFQPPKYA